MTQIAGIVWWMTHDIQKDFTFGIEAVRFVGRLWQPSFDIVRSRIRGVEIVRQPADGTFHTCQSDGHCRRPGEVLLVELLRPGFDVKGGTLGVADHAVHFQRTTQVKAVTRLFGIRRLRRPALPVSLPPAPHQ